MAAAEEICEWPSTSLTGYEGRRFASAEALATQLDGVLQLDAHEEHVVHESFTADIRGTTRTTHSVASCSTCNAIPAFPQSTWK